MKKIAKENMKDQETPSTLHAQSAIEEFQQIASRKIEAKNIWKTFDGCFNRKILQHF